jgi:hypothetical protein
MKTVISCFMVCLVLLVLSFVTANAQFSGKVCYVTASSATTFPASSYTNSAEDGAMIAKLVSWGFTVDVAIAGNATGTGSFNNTTTPTPSDSVLATYKLMICSDASSSNNCFRIRGLPLAGPTYNTINVPCVILKSWLVKQGSNGLVGTNTASATTYNNTTANSVDFVAGAPATFSAGYDGKTGVVLSTATTESAGNYMSFYVPTGVAGQTIYPVATVSGSTTQLIAWGAEQGSSLYDNSGVIQQTIKLKKRVAGVGIVFGAYLGITSDGYSLIKNAISWALEKTTSVDQAESVPTGFSLKQNYPNPFNPSTEIAFTLMKEGMTTLSVFNVLGQKVATIINQNLSAGTHHYTFDASTIASGVYFYRLDSGSYSSIKKMMLVK